MSSLFGGGKKQNQKPQAAAAPAPQDKMANGAMFGAGNAAQLGSNVLSSGNSARGTFLGY